jgi:carboxypeptidase family protein
MAIDVKIRVRLCPHQKLADKQPADPTWPSPAGAVIEFTKKNSRGAAKPLVTTGSDGEASTTLDAGTYTAKPVDTWDEWVCVTGELEVNDKTKVPLEVRLVPPEEYRLLPVRLVRHDHAGPDRDDEDYGNEKGSGDEDASERHAPAGIPESMIQVKVADRGFEVEFGPSSEAGYIYAWAPSGYVDVHFPKWTSPEPEEKTFKPVYDDVTFKLPGPTHKRVYIAELPYKPAGRDDTPPETPSDNAQISIEPKVEMPSSQPRRYEPLTGASVTVFLHPLGSDPVFLEGTLAEEEKEISFPDQASGFFSGIVAAPDTFNGWPVKGSDKPIGHHFLPAGEKVVVPVEFELDKTWIEGQVLTPQGTPFEEELYLNISYPGMKPVQVTARNGKFSAKVPTGAPLTIYLAPGAKPTLDNLPLEMDPAKQDVLPPPQVTTVTLVYEHYIKGQTVDENRDPMPYAVVDVFDGPEKVASAVSDQDGFFLVGLKDGGNYIVSVQTEGSEPVTAKPVTISSGHDLGQLAARRRVLEARLGPSGGTTPPGGGAGGNGSGEVREAFTDLAAYPVLTEEVSTTGVPAPAAGGTGGGGGGGAAYGQVVDQAMRDVLGWRPGGDLGGFQAALTGAFQLREVEGHTEWAWQQRGYAVQADMGALTGAQAAIYARAKSALDQILPLLAGLTPLNPALFPPQDLEAIRTVITAELQELVSELALQGGPRIQRVDQLFQLLTGERAGSKNLNPDVVQGNLGTLRDRFGLTTDEIDTVDEERIVTNFRIVVEQVLSLQATWGNDRGLLAPLDPRASFGTILIWLSRSLEAVCESVGDLNFALDSVFVDAAQRQVLELKFHGEEALLLSDLLDWVDRASRDEGPRIIQDAGKDGVFAFAPVLRRLRDLIQKTQKAAKHDSRLPQGLRTPRVERALQVLVAQLDEATELASAVRRDAPPVIEAALVSAAKPTTHLGSSSGQLPTLENLQWKPASIKIDILGANFRTGASAVLIAQDREDLPELHTWQIKVSPPNSILATFRNPRTVPDSSGVTWLVTVINEDGTHSNQFPI